MNKQALKRYAQKLSGIERNAVLELAAKRKAHHDAVAQKQALERYQRLYMREFRTKAKQGMLSLQMQHYHQFVSHIRATIARQEKNIDQTQQKVEQALAQWRQAFVAYKSVQILIDRLEKKEQIRQENLEQDLQEEFINSHLLRQVGTEFERK